MSIHFDLKLLEKYDIDDFRTSILNSRYVPNYYDEIDNSFVDRFLDYYFNKKKVLHQILLKYGKLKFVRDL